MESNLNEFEQESRARPTLLTVLCILTFIGSTLTIGQAIYAYSTAPETVMKFSEARARLRGDSILQKDSVPGERHRKGFFFGQKMMISLSNMVTEGNIRKTAVGSIVSGLFTLLGALLMWRLRRNGYYLYIVGIVAGLIVPFYLYWGNLMAIGVSLFSSFFGLVFIALYALNIKSLR